MAGPRSAGDQLSQKPTNLKTFRSHLRWIGRTTSGGQSTWTKQNGAGFSAMTIFDSVSLFNWVSDLLSDLYGWPERYHSPSRTLPVLRSWLMSMTVWGATLSLSSRGASPIVRAWSATVSIAASLALPEKIPSGSL